MAEITRAEGQCYALIKSIGSALVYGQFGGLNDNKIFNEFYTALLILRICFPLSATSCY